MRLKYLILLAILPALQIALGFATTYFVKNFTVSEEPRVLYRILQEHGGARQEKSPAESTLIRMVEEAVMEVQAHHTESRILRDGLILWGQIFQVWGGLHLLALGGIFWHSRKRQAEPGTGGNAC